MPATVQFQQDFEAQREHNINFGSIALPESLGGNECGLSFCPSPFEEHKTLPK
jgi:hypothetical protein